MKTRFPDVLLWATSQLETSVKGSLREGHMGLSAPEEPLSRGEADWVQVL